MRVGVEASAVVHQRTVNLPQDILEIIIIDLGDDLLSLKAFSTTCYSWYIAAAPHLHHTLTLEERPSDQTRAELKPLANLGKMGLLPFVKKLWIQCSSFEPWISPRKFDQQTLRYFSALTNVQQLRIERFDLSKFMPGIERYFGHFAPELRSISLMISSGTQRQLLYFLSLFPNLDDIEIEYHPTANPDATTNPGSEEVAIPFSVPSLRGQLKLTHFPSETISRDMITLFGGLRFRYMDLCSVEGSRLLLDACADTLQTVRIDPVVPNSTESILTPQKFTLTERIETSGGLPQDFDLSHLRSLQSLEVTASSVSQVHQGTPHLLRDIASTIKSQAFSEVVLIFQHPDLYRPSHIPFNAFRQMYSKKKFRLVFCLEVSKKYRDVGFQAMWRRMELEMTHRRLDFLESPPTLMVSERNCWTG